MHNPKNLITHEIIGLTVEVSDSSNASHKGISGKVIDETMKTIKIESSDGKIRTIQKSGSTLIFRIDNKQVEVSGEQILSRPQDRIKKRVRKW